MLESLYMKQDLMSFKVFNTNKTGVHAEFNLMKIMSANFQKMFIIFKTFNRSDCVSQIMWSTLFNVNLSTDNPC